MELKSISVLLISLPQMKKSLSEYKYSFVPKNEYIVAAQRWKAGDMDSLNLHKSVLQVMTVYFPSIYDIEIWDGEE